MMLNIYIVEFGLGSRRECKAETADKAAVHIAKMYDLKNGDVVTVYKESGSLVGRFLLMSEMTYTAHEVK